MIFDLIAAHQQPLAAPQWTPELLFLPGDEGAWYDGSDYSKMFMDPDGTLLITGPDQPVGLWKPSFASHPVNYDLRQSTAEYRPVTATTNGKLSVLFNPPYQSLRSNNNVLSYSTATLAAGATMTPTDITTAQIVDSNPNYGGFQLQMTHDQITGENEVLLGHNTRSTNTITSGVPFVGMLQMVYGVSEKVVLDTITTDGSPPYPTFTYVQMSIAQTSIPKNISQIVFINRAISAAEISKLASFIASKQ